MNAWLCGSPNAIFVLKLFLLGKSDFKGGAAWPVPACVCSFCGRCAGGRRAHGRCLRVSRRCFRREGHGRPYGRTMHAGGWPYSRICKGKFCTSHCPWGISHMLALPAGKAALGRIFIQISRRAAGAAKSKRHRRLHVVPALRMAPLPPRHLLRFDDRRAPFGIDRHPCCGQHGEGTAYLPAAQSL